MTKENVRAGIIGMIVLLLVLLSIQFISAEFLGCFDYRQTMHYCQGYKPDFRCNIENGCTKCLSVYNESANCFIHGVSYICNSLDPDECTYFGDNNLSDDGGIDTSPPNPTIYSPTQNGVYSKRTVLFNLESNEQASIYYMDAIEGRERWKTICTNCYNYNRALSMNDGWNNLTIKAVDDSENVFMRNISFFVDSKDPQIKKILPKANEFASGIFEVQIKEDNPASLKINYGNSISGYREYNFNLQTQCSPGGNGIGTVTCIGLIDLEDYNGEDLFYNATLVDVAGNVEEYKKQEVKVDTQDPLLNNPLDYWSYVPGERYVKFKMNITEANFDEITYNYIDSRGRVVEKTLCSNLRYGMCDTKKSFTRGNYNLTITIKDDAGNYLGLSLPVEVTY